MGQKKSPESVRNQEQIIAEARRKRAELENTYRERALKLFPKVCGRCGREFSGKKLRELTVHHKDHNHDNNPADGSNWELLCIYCHDNEHGRNEVADAYAGGAGNQDVAPSDGFRPFADLASLLRQKSEK